MLAMCTCSGSDACAASSQRPQSPRLAVQCHALPDDVCEGEGPTPAHKVVNESYKRDLERKEKREILHEHMRRRPDAYARRIEI